MVGLRRLENLRNVVQRCIDEDIRGHLIETGVRRGGCRIFMRGVLGANGVQDRNVYVADSFEGPPPPTAPKDAGDIITPSLNLRSRSQRSAKTSKGTVFSMTKWSS